MGTDINGWIECKTQTMDLETWAAVMALGYVYLGRDYDAFGCLFGVRNDTHFRPIAPDRGVPDDASDQVKGAASVPGLYGQTWISWHDIQQIDWEESAEPVTYRLHTYKRTPSGDLAFIGIHVYDKTFEEQVGYDERDWQEGEAWEYDGLLFRVERLKRKAIKAG